MDHLDQSLNPTPRPDTEFRIQARVPREFSPFALLSHNATTQRYLKSLNSLQQLRKCLVDRIVWHRGPGEHFGLLHSEASLGHAWGTLGDDLLAILLGLDLGGIVGLDTVEEFLPDTEYH